LEGRVFFLDTKVAFREEDNLVSGDVVLLQSLCDNLLGVAMGVNISLCSVLLALTLKSLVDNRGK
jgi:hypothetical protein